MIIEIAFFAPVVCWLPIDCPFQLVIFLHDNAIRSTHLENEVVHNSKSLLFDNLV